LRHEDVVSVCLCLCLCLCLSVSVSVSVTVSVSASASVCVWFIHSTQPCVILVSTPFQTISYMICVEPVLSSCILAFFFCLQVELVLNYDIPKDHKDYIHRFQSFPNNPRDVFFFIPSSFNTPLTPLFPSSFNTPWTPLFPSIVARPTQCMYAQVRIMCVCTGSMYVSTQCGYMYCVNVCIQCMYAQVRIICVCTVCTVFAYVLCPQVWALRWSNLPFSHHLLLLLLFLLALFSHAFLCYDTQKEGNSRRGSLGKISE